MASAAEESSLFVANRSRYANGSRPPEARGLPAFEVLRHGPPFRRLPKRESNHHACGLPVARRGDLVGGGSGGLPEGKMSDYRVIDTVGDPNVGAGTPGPSREPPAGPRAQHDDSR